MGWTGVGTCGVEWAGVDAGGTRAGKGGSEMASTDVRRRANEKALAGEETNGTEMSEVPRGPGKMNTAAQNSRKYTLNP